MSHTFVNIGRHRGEFERAAKKLVQAHAGVKHPRDLGFIAQADLADRMAAAMVKINGMPKEGRLQRGVPDDRWARAVAGNPLRRLAPEQLWIFLPERRELQITGGHVVPRVDGESIPFGNPELFAALGQGYRLIVHFDPAEPTLGAAILNNESPNSTRNIEGWRVGEVLGLADFVSFAPQYKGHASFTPSIEYRKRYHNFVSASYRATGLYGHRAGKADSMRDGTGRVAEVERKSPTEKATENPLVARGAAHARKRNDSNPFAPASPEVFERQSRRNERLLAATRAASAHAAECV